MKKILRITILFFTLSSLFSCKAPPKYELAGEPLPDVYKSIDIEKMPTENLFIPLELMAIFPDSQEWTCNVYSTGFIPDYVESYANISCFPNNVDERSYGVDKRIWTLKREKYVDQFIEDLYEYKILFPENELYPDIDLEYYPSSSIDGFILRKDHDEDFGLYIIDLVLQQGKVISLTKLRLSDDVNLEEIESILKLSEESQLD